MTISIQAHARRAAVGAGGLALAALVPWFASCATTQEDASAPVPVEASPLPTGDAGVEADADAPPEAGCDASDRACVTHVVTCAEASWCPSPAGVSSLYALTSVWGSSKNDVWAVGSGGTIVHYDGTAWTPTPTGIKNTFYAVVGSSATDVWAVSASDVMLHSTGFTGGTTTWTPFSAAPTKYDARPVYAAWATAAGDLQVGGSSFYFFSPDGSSGPVNQFTRAKLPDGGVAWNAVKGQGTVRGIWGSSDDDVWILDDNSQSVGWQLGLTLHGTRGDGGDLVWRSVDSQSSVLLSAVWGSSASDVWAVGDKGTIRHLAKDATHWDPVDSTVTERLHGIWGSAADDVWAVGDSGTILHYDGARWSSSLAAFPIGKKPNLYGVWGSARADVWIVGDGIALHFLGEKPGAQGGSK